MSAPPCLSTMCRICCMHKSRGEIGNAGVTAATIGALTLVVDDASVSVEETSLDLDLADNAYRNPSMVTNGNRSISWWFSDRCSASGWRYALRWKDDIWMFCHRDILTLSHLLWWPRLSRGDVRDLKSLNIVPIAVELITGPRFVIFKVNNWATFVFYKKLFFEKHYKK